MQYKIKAENLPQKTIKNKYCSKWIKNQNTRVKTLKLSQENRYNLDLSDGFWMSLRAKVTAKNLISAHFQN